jgi:hypothetical protein
LLLTGLPNVEGVLPFTYGQLVDVTVSKRHPFVKVTFAFGTAVEKLKQSGNTLPRWPGTTQNLVPAVSEYEPINRALTPVIVSAVNVAKVVFGAEDPLLAIIRRVAAGKLALYVELLTTPTAIKTFIAVISPLVPAMYLCP